MKKFSLIIKSITLALSMVGTAYAEDIFSHHSLLNSWTGLYTGVDAGFVFNNAQLKSQQLGFTSLNNSCDINADFSEFFSGAQVGYLYQFPNAFVSGVEANVTVNNNQKNSVSCNSEFNPAVYDGFTFRNQLQTSIKARVGRATNWHNNILLPYLTAGVSFANLGLTYQNEGGDYYSASTAQVGWLIGAGIEWAFLPNWSLRAEYYYVDYGNAVTVKIPSVYGLIDPDGSAHVNLYSNHLLVALNYWI